MKNKSDVEKPSPMAASIPYVEMLKFAACTAKRPRSIRPVTGYVSTESRRSSLESDHDLVITVNLFEPVVAYQAEHHHRYWKRILNNVDIIILYKHIPTHNPSKDL